MDTFYGSYISALRPYHIETENATAAIIPKEVARKIYGLSQEGVMNAFLQFHWITGGCKAYTTLIHLVSHNIPWMGMPALPWDDLSFTLKGEVTCGAIGCDNWLMEIFYQINTDVYIPAEEAIN